MGFPRAVTWVGATGTFGSLPSLTQTASGTGLGTHPVASWGFGAGEALFYSALTPDGKLVLSTESLMENALDPTYDHCEINIYDPAADVFYRIVVPTSTGQLTAVKPSYLVGGSDGGGGDVCVTADGRVLFTSTLGYDGWDLAADGAYPSIGFLVPGNAGWSFDNYAKSKTSNQLQATNPAAYATLAGAPPAGQPYSTRGIDQVALLPASGNVAIAHYFPGSGFNSGCLTVWDSSANLLCAYQIPSMNAQDGVTAITMSPREVKADPSSIAGDERFMVIYDVFPIAGPAVVPNHVCQEFSYNSGTQTITPMTCPFIASDDNWLPASCYYGADGTFYAAGSPATGGGLTVFQASNMAVWVKHAASGNRGYVAAAPATGAWATNGSYATLVTPDWSLGFPSRQSLAAAVPLAMDSATGSVLYTGISGLCGAGIPDTAAIPDPTVTPPVNLIPGAPTSTSPYGFEDVTNLLPAEDALLGTPSSVGDWVTVSATCTLAWTAAGSCPVTPPSGSNAIKLTALSNGISQIWTNSPGWAPVSAGGKYGYYAAFLSASAGRTCTVQVRWLNSAGTFLSTSTLFSGSDNSASWTTVAGEATAPGNAAWARLVVTADSTTIGEVHYVAAMGVPSLAAPAGWSGFVTTITRDNQVTRSGGYSLAMTAPFNQATVSASSPFLPVTAGREYLATGYVKAGATAGPAKLQVKFFDANFASLATSLETYTPNDSSSSWTYLYAADLAPAGSAWAQWVIVAATALAGDVAYADDVAFSPQPWVSLPRADIGILQLRSDLGTTAIGPGRPSVSGRTMWIPVGNSFTAAQQSAYTTAQLTPPGYAPDMSHPQWLVALDLGTLLGPSVSQSWSGAYAPALSLAAGAVPAPGNLGLAVPVAMPAGDWAVAVVSWRQPAGSPAVTIASVADDAHSWWEPLGAPQATSGPQGVTRTVVWYAPRSRASTVVQASPTGFVLALAMIVLDVTGMSDWIALTPLATGYANAATALSMSSQPGGSVAFMVAGAGSDLLTATISGPGAGWSAVSPVTASNGADHTSDLQLNVAWQSTSSEADANWASTAPVDFSGVLGGIIAAPAALAQPNRNWPIVIPEAAVGAGQYTPADSVAWQALQAPVLDLAFTQGRQYERDELATGDGSLTMWNPTGLALPPGFPQSMGVDSGTPVRVRCYWPGPAGGAANPTPWYVPFSGLIERLPQKWDPDTWQGIVDATVTDQWASLTENMQSILAAELLEDNPGDLWPCTDLATSLVAANIVPSNSNPLFVTQSKYGTGGATQAFGQNGDALPGALGTLIINPQFRVNSQSGMWGQTLPNTLFGSGLGYSLQALSSSFPGVSAGVTIEFWFSVAAPIQVSANTQALLSVFALNMPQFYVFVEPPPAISGTGFLSLYTAGPAGGIGSATISAVNYQVDGLPLTHVALTFNTTTWTAYVNGAQTASGSWASPLAPVFTALSVNGSSVVNRSVSFGATSGFFGWIAIYNRILHPLRILTHYEAGATGMSGDPASYRVERILAASTDAAFRRFIGYETSFTTGGSGPTSVVSCADLPGSPAGQGITNIASSIPPGMLFITPGGEIFLLTKEKAFGQAYKWTFGENTVAGEIPYEADAELGYDPQHVTNLPTLTQLDSQNIVTSQVPAVTQASENQYGQVTANLTGYLKGDSTVALNFGAGLYDEANWIADVLGKPLMRGEAITVIASGNPSSWDAVLGVSVGDPALLNRRPLGLASPGVISIPVRVSQTRRRLVFGYDGQVTGEIKLILDAMPEVNVLTCDDPVKGRLDRTHILGW